MEFAAATGWAVLTHDLDFGALLAASRTKTPSMVQVRCQDVLPSALGDIVVRAIRTAEPHLEAGALVTVDALRHRIRLLPI
jgi:predicted nuclease of predicted toxin-antitoxin system